MKGELRRIVGDREAAIDYFTKALAKRKSNVLALLGRAAALIDMNKDAEAQKDLQTVLTLVPKHPMALYLAGADAGQEEGLCRRAREAAGGRPGARRPHAQHLP